MRIRLNFGEFFLSRDSPNRGYVVIRAKTEKALLTLIRNVCFQMQPEFQAKIEGPPLYDGPFQVRVDKAQWPSFLRYFVRTTRIDSTHFFDKLPYLLPTLPGGTCRPVFELPIAPPTAHRPSVPAKMLRPQPKEPTPSAKPNPKPAPQPSPAPKFAPLPESLFPAITDKTAKVSAAMVAMIADFSDPGFDIYESYGFQGLPPHNCLFGTFVLHLKEGDFLISALACRELEGKVGSHRHVVERLRETPRDQLLSFHLTRYLFAHWVHLNPRLEMTSRLVSLFCEGNLLSILLRLRDAQPALHSVLSPQGQTGLENSRSNPDLKEIWDGDTKYLGYMAREEGRFGSLCKADNYGDESNAEDHDNEWYDSLTE